MIYVMCPAGSYTGGPTLAHQLCYMLNNLGINASMWYFCSPWKRKKIEPVHPLYKHFNNPYVVDKPADISTNTIVALESKTSILKEFKNAKRTIWWMSVDNYYLNMGNFVEVLKRKYFHFKPTLEYSKRFKDKKKYLEFKKPDIIHYVQSEYAKSFLLNEGIDESKIFELGDYIEDDIIEAHKFVDFSDKRDSILYNPKKGYEFTKKIILQNPQYDWVPLINMTKQEVIRALLSSKLYIDFGTHPGKDRFPREAVLCGCCVITGLKGAAANSVDIPIPKKYKFEDNIDCLDDISMAISDIISNYPERIKDFEPYCIRTLNEKENFRKEVEECFG